MTQILINGLKQVLPATTNAGVNTSVTQSAGQSTTTFSWYVKGTGASWSFSYPDSLSFFDSSNYGSSSGWVELTNAGLPVGLPPGGAPIGQSGVLGCGHLTRLSSPTPPARRTPMGDYAVHWSLHPGSSNTTAWACVTRVPRVIDVPGIVLSVAHQSCYLAGTDGQVRDGRVSLHPPSALPISGTASGWGGAFMASTPAAGNTPRTIRSLDVNGDGNADLLFVNHVSSSFSVMLGDGSGGYAVRTDLSVPTGPVGLVMGDFNNDGNVDAALTSDVARSVSVLLGDGTGRFALRSSVQAAFTPYDLAVVGAGIVVSGIDGNAVQSFSVDPTGGLTPGGTLATGASPTGLATVDLGDGLGPGLVVANSQAGTVSLFRSALGGGFGNRVDIPVGANPISIAAGDVNGDGRADVVVSLNGQAAVAVLLNAGNGTFAAPAILPTGNNPLDVAVADVNYDGKLDIVTANYNADSITVHFGDGAGGFSNRRDVPAGPGPYALTVGLFNRDCKPDIAVSNYGGSRLTVLLGQ